MKFKRITARTKLTFPCMFARLCSDGTWAHYVAYDATYAHFARADYTHWMPFQWPGRKP